MMECSESGETRMDYRWVILFKVSTNTLGAGPAYQWIDGVEIHTDLPVSRLKH